MKYCEDCRWLKKGWFGRVSRDARCLHENVMVIDGTQLVSPNYAIYAQVERNNGNCGLDAKFWEAR